MSTKIANLNFQNLLLCKHDVIKNYTNEHNFLKTILNAYIFEKLSKVNFQNLLLYKNDVTKLQ